MGSYSILVIGDWREQLEPHLDVGEIGNPLSPYITCTDLLNTALVKEFRQSHKNVRRSQQEPFQIWLKKYFCINTLAANENPDLAGAHRYGWIQLNAKGEVSKVIRRNIGSLIRYVSGENAQFLLKPGAIGWEVNPYQPNDLVASGRYASSARVCDIDFATMRQPHITSAPTNWERAYQIAAGRTWVPLKEIRKQYTSSDPIRPGSDSFCEYERAAREWLGQPVVQQLREEGCLAHLSANLLDAMMLQRDDYIRHCVQHAPVLEYFDVLHQHRFLLAPDESDLLAELNDETVLTSVNVKH